ncbi:helix-turn-helix domain-containing protein [Clostridium cylindrosporum]|uniref:Putative transcriptional regulator n=1 Tax=Clostridium cylindrosporum DSM 605 TaxID=1121307 RepID=A0A0J8DBA8_CLOCY|nr:helix-turn-helix domain-containing protein [Clostridium cylindrosporum]KMT21568.1 putative transcriptional regulator [Clostridium cylindrosporum DSM 605]
MNIGEKLKHAREEKKLTLKSLADISGVGQSTISDIENGLSKNPRRDTLNKLANALDVSISDLFSDTTSNKNEDTSSKKAYLNIDIVPEEFTDANLARQYVNKHQIFGSHGFDPDKLDDSEILEFANELLKQMEMVSFKYRK